MLNAGSISSHKKQYINEASILRLRPNAIEEIGDDESFYLYQQCQRVLYESLNKNDCNEVALVYVKDTHEEGNLILGTETNVDLESDTKTQELLLRNDDKICILVHNHPRATSFSIEDYAEFILYGKMKVMVVVTNTGEQYFMIKTEEYDMKKAVKKLVQITRNFDHDDDKHLTRSESVAAARQFEKIAYTIGIRIE